MAVTVKYENGKLRYYQNGRPMSDAQVERRFAHVQKPDYEKGECPATQPPKDSGWEYESGGKGRYISQLASKPGDPNAYCRSREEIREKAKRAGFTQIQDA